MYKVLVVGLNPALQRTLWFDKFKVGQVNRCSKVRYSVGGKGTNVARVLGQLGVSCKMLTFLGGTNGDRVKCLLPEEGILHKAIFCQHQTRICSTLLDQSDGSQTELVEEGVTVSNEEAEEMWQLFVNELTQCSYVVIAGSTPPGVATDLYSKMITLANRKDKKTILDAQRDLLMKNLSAHPWIAKPNLAELKAALGNSSPLNSAFDLADELVKRGARNAIVSQGEKGVWVTGDVKAQVRPPRQKTINAIGSGDAMTAGIIAYDLQDKSFIETIRYGVACGAANTLTPLAGNVRIQDVERILPHVTVEEA